MTWVSCAQCGTKHECDKGSVRKPEIRPIGFQCDVHGLIENSEDCPLCRTAVKTEFLDRIRQAQAGQRGPQQKLIALKGLEVVDLLLRKNHDYGGSVFESPEMLPNLKPTEALMVRISDKVQRMKSLLTQEAEVAEPMEDTMKDLAGYAMLWLCCNWIGQGKWDDE